MHLKYILVYLFFNRDVMDKYLRTNNSEWMLNLHIIYNAWGYLIIIIINKNDKMMLKEITNLHHLNMQVVTIKKIIIINKSMKWKTYLGKMHYYFTKKFQVTVCTAKIHLWDENTLLLLVLRCLLITLNEYSENILYVILCSVHIMYRRGSQTLSETFWHKSPSYILF